MKSSFGLKSYAQGFLSIKSSVAALIDAFGISMVGVTFY